MSGEYGKITENEESINMATENAHENVAVSQNMLLIEQCKYQYQPTNTSVKTTATHQTHEPNQQGHVRIQVAVAVSILIGLINRNINPEKTFLHEYVFERKPVRQHCHRLAPVYLC